jgi:GTP pyrophosphokinase
MAHPLTMACHALAMGLKDDDVLAAALAHDMVEDAHMKLSELPVNDRVREAVRLVSKNMYDPNEPDWEKQYFANIRKNPLACIVKCLDRTNNLAGMADAFSRKWMIRYTEETDHYYPALLDVLKKVPEWNDVWWLLRYQMMTMTEAFKRLL